MNNEVKYKGGGHVNGLPARDMTLKEWESTPPALRESAMQAGLYALPTAQPVKADSKEKDK